MWLVVFVIATPRHAGAWQSLNLLMVEIASVTSFPRNDILVTEHKSRVIKGLSGLFGGRIGGRIRFLRR
jgi:hypothetical protein